MIIPPARLSIIISNCNYERFLASCIQSALDIDWPQKQIIVVDDGSTDRSREIIESFGDQIQSVYHKNGGQTVAYNTGFTLSKGDALLFLDADDLVDPSAMLELAKVWNDSVSKVQYQMRIINADGISTGAYFPQFIGIQSPDEIRKSCMDTSAYQTPPGSANIYSRHFLELIFPLDDKMDKAGDSFLLAAAPFGGDVVTINKPLFSYRSHGNNQGIHSSLDVNKLRKEISTAIARFHYQQAFALTRGYEIPERAIGYSLSLLPIRLAAFLLDQHGHPFPNESRLRLAKDFAVGFSRPQGLKMSSKVALAMWFYTVLMLPACLASPLISLRILPYSRPAFLVKIMKTLRVIK
jgi:glycosyltransferase involved in cell wall biosynthesis